MVESYAPHVPLNVPKPVADNVWVVDGPEITFGYLGLKAPFPTRMTVVRLADGGLWLHSPTALTADIASSLEAIGPIQCLIAPNTLHYWWIPDWKDRFPKAQVFGPRALERSAKRKLPPFVALADEAPTLWRGVIDQVLVKGDALTELDFFHRPSRTLILTDLIENFEPSRVRSPWLRWLVRWSGAVDPDGKAPIDMQLSFLRTRKQVRAAVERMLSWGPERVILSHGRWYDANGAAELRRAFRWVL